MNESTNLIRSKYYRISAKALILNETKDGFLITKEDNGLWELPGGGLEWGETPQIGIAREIQEEMGIPVMSVAPRPSYFLTCSHGTPTLWIANVLYETTLEHFNFTPSSECTEIAFINQAKAHEFNLFPNVQLLLEQFNAQYHRP